MGLPLVTRQEYKTYQGITSNSSDSVIDELIVKVSELVKTMCRRTFVDYVDDIKVEYNEGGSNAIYLEEYPVISISQVEYSTDYGNSYTTLTEYTNYVLSKTTNSLRPLLMTAQSYDETTYSAYSNYGNKVEPIFPEAINGYRISYTAGYQVIPQDLKLAILDIIAYYIKNDSAIHTHKLANPNTMQVEYISSTHFPAHIKRILDLYTANYN